jgi:anti-sigma regulatory factor (Ser/Thr protein kinase)
VSSKQSRPVEQTHQSIGGTTRDTANVWPLRSSLELGALPTAVPCARLHARLLVWEWGLDGLAATTELLVSELVTNAVQATAGQDDPTAVCLQLFGDQARVRIEVWDADLRPPAPKELAEDGVPDLVRDGGRGLFLVGALSMRWDWYFTREPTGKVVWCEIEAERPEIPEVGGPASWPLLPQRICRQVQVRPIVVMNDPDILRRLRDRLRELDRI